MYANVKSPCSTLESNIILYVNYTSIKKAWWGFPGGPAVKTLRFHCAGSIPGQGSPARARCGQKQTNKQTKPHDAGHRAWVPAFRRAQCGQYHDCGMSRAWWEQRREPLAAGHEGWGAAWLWWGCAWPGRYVLENEWGFISRGREFQAFWKVVGVEVEKTNVLFSFGVLGLRHFRVTRLAWESEHLGTLAIQLWWPGLPSQYTWVFQFQQKQARKKQNYRWREVKRVILLDQELPLPFQEIPGSWGGAPAFSLW